jgi:hypothetical protein
MLGSSSREAAFEIPELVKSTSSDITDENRVAVVAAKVRKRIIGHTRMKE